MRDASHTCENCRWWHGREHFGECRHSPPAPPREGWGALWPTTALYEWCGQWTEKAQKEDDAQ